MIGEYNKNYRNVGMDCMTGLMILCVCLCHIDPNCIIVQVLFFFMPWFFFKAGYFFKEEPLLIVIKKGCHRLFVPFLFFSCCGFLARMLQFKDDLHYNFITTQISSFFETGAPWCLPTMWFLTALFICRIILSLIRNKLMLLGGAIIGLIIVTLDGYNMMPFKYMPLIHVCSSLFFCLMGKLAREIPNLSSHKYVYLILLFLILIICPSRIDMRTNVLLQGDYFTAFVGCICGCFLCLELAQNIKSAVVLNYLGRNSMTIFCTHGIVLIIVRCFYKDGLYSIALELSVLCLSMPFLISLFSSRKLKWLIGE